MNIFRVKVIIKWMKTSKSLLASMHKVYPIPLVSLYCKSPINKQKKPETERDLYVATIISTTPSSPIMSKKKYIDWK